MKVPKLKFKHLVSSFLSIMESGKTVQLSLSMCCFSIFLGLCENLSYYFKLRFFVFSDRKLVFIKNAIFYSNFSNVLYFFESPTFATIIFLFVQVLVYYFILYLFLVTFLRKFRFFKILKTNMITYLNYLFQYFVSLYYWVLFVPILELFSNILDCDWYSYLQKECSSSHLYLSILSIVATIITFIIGFFILWLYRTYMFIEKGLLKKKFTIALAILYTTKMILIVIFPIVKNNMSFVIFLLLHIVGLYSLYDYVRNFPITNSFLSRFYASVLTCYEFLCIIFTVFEYTNFIEEESLFYVIAFVMVLGVKLGLTIYETIYHNQLKSNLENPQFIGYCLEELYRLYHARHSCNKDALFLGGVLKSHISKCKLAKCVLKEEVLNKFDFMDLEAREKLINRFISQTFVIAIKNMRTKNNSNIRNIELNILKFSSFIQKNNASPLKAFYEMQKIFSLSQQKSFYFQSISLNVLQQIREIINLYESKWFKTDSPDDNKELEVQTFFEMFKEKNLLKKLFITLLEKKFLFWDKYKDGFHTYSEVFEILSDFLNEAVNVRNFIERNLIRNKNSQKRIFDLKFKTILECIIFNNVNSAVKNEDELDKLKKKELTLEKNILNCDSFFSGNYTTVQASFLQSHGKILECSKKERLANFFNFSFEEVKSLNEIQSLMPKFIGNCHDKFVNWHLKKDRTLNTKEKKFIPSYGLDKKGFIFPIKIYVGFNFDYRYDIVFHAALLDLHKRNETLLLFDSNGQILGLTKDFFRLFQIEIKENEMEIFESLNIFNFAPNLNSIVKKNNFFEKNSNESLLNLVTQIYFPQNFEEILTIFSLKIKEEKEAKAQSRSYSKSIVSMKSQKTVKTLQSSKSAKKSYDSNKSKSTKFLGKFLKEWNHSIEEKIEIERKFQDKEISNSELLDLLIDKNSCRRHKINFNLKIIRYFYSEDDSLAFCQLTINKMSKDLREISSSAGKNANKFNTFYDPRTDISQQDLFNKISEIEMEPLRKEDEVDSNFLVMPMTNVPMFRNNALETEEKENNRLMTTENDVIHEEEKKISFQKDVETLIVNDRENTKKNEINSSKNYDNTKNNNNKKQTINKTPPPESFINTSEHSNALKEGIFGFNNTSNQRVIDLLEHSSQKSSITNIKKTFTVFSFIHLIQQNVPSCLQNFRISQYFEFLIILGYCIAVYVMSVQYIDNYFNPLNEGALNFAKMYNTYSCTNLVTVEYEYAIYNFTNYQNGFTYDTEFKEIIKESFEVLKELINVERSKPSVFSYQNFFKNVFIEASDFNLPKMDSFLFVEFLDFIVKELYELEQKNFVDMTLEKLEYFSINFMNFLGIYHKISESIGAEFFDSNQTISNALKIIMVVFIVLIAVLRFFECFQIDFLYKRMIRILNIFLRVNQKEAFGEIFLTKDIQRIVADPLDSYVNYNFIDKVLMKRETTFLAFENEENNGGNSPSRRKKAKEKKNTRKKLSFQDLKTYSRLPLFSYIMFFGALVVIYIAMSYYYFITINAKIENLIKITIFFQDIYTLPTSALMINRIILRERVITNQLYNFPDQLQRKQYLLVQLDEYMKLLQDNNELIAIYSLDAVNKINKDNFKYILYGDACEALRMTGLIAENQVLSCQNCLNKAFQKGISSITTEILRMIRDEDEIRVIYTDSAQIASQLQMTYQRLKSNTGVDRVIADFYLNKLLMLFYQDLENFYKDEMISQTNSLKNVILAMTIILAFVFMVQIYFSKKYFDKIYRNISLSLNLIPYEKLLNDEQILFLIKKSWRE